jgi:uncharacterized membrane-anchored protein
MRGVARVDAKTKQVANRLRPGEIAVISHEDLDAVSAESLVAAGAGAVVNARDSITGRYANRGAGILLEAGIPLIDKVGEEITRKVADGDELRLEGATVCSNGSEIATGRLVSEEDVRESCAAGRENLRVELARFVVNTLERVAEEDDLVFDSLADVPVDTEIEGRHVVVVTRGEGHRDDLNTIRTYIGEVRPVLIGVDGGADAILELGRRPDIVVGDMDSASDEALRAASEILVHAYEDGRAPGQERVEALGLPYKCIRAKGTSEDVALNLAFDKGADMIVAVGAHSSLVDFLDKGRGGMASTFLSRLKVGDRLVDARGVSRLYREGITGFQLAALILAGCLTASAIVALSPFVQGFIRVVGVRIELFFSQLWRAAVG